MVALAERAPLWVVQVGTYRNSSEIRAAIAEKSFGLEGRASDLLEQILLATKPGFVEVFEITARDAGFSEEVPRRHFYKEVAKSGFIPVQPEIGPQALIQFGHEFEVGQWRLVGSKEMRRPDKERYPLLFSIGRNAVRSRLDVDEGRTTIAYYLDDVFLFQRVHSS